MNVHSQLEQWLHSWKSGVKSSGHEEPQTIRLRTLVLAIRLENTLVHTPVLVTILVTILVLATIVVTTLLVMITIVITLEIATILVLH